LERLQWQKLAERCLVDAKVLLDAHRWSAAYYLAGYAVECGLKSCILARVASMPGLIFADRRFSEKCWTHDFQELVVLAGLKGQHAAARAANPGLQSNWTIAKDWKESTRYDAMTHWSAKRLYNAIVNKPNGVMQWIKARW
jgi:hypothetical protein